MQVKVYERHEVMQLLRRVDAYWSGYGPAETSDVIHADIKAVLAADGAAYDAAQTRETVAEIEARLKRETEDEAERLTAGRSAASFTGEPGNPVGLHSGLPVQDTDEHHQAIEDGKPLPELL